ncbi:hypothetical protein L1987_08279 [Smallanthus sonchifolius]|uniref:Uncharacterized protein n=1 Tax=Smallanthus sonchifolius TaxID=185202 RepID=A0ACB9JKP0_9ASTR|nr:hypothetical protein L1987_08279 [Smallanthus sonchifolius]
MTRIPNSVNKSSSPATIKFLYSYGGKILPRKTDGKLRYIGGHTRVLAAYRSVTYAELIVRFLEACGFSVNLKCKLPSEGLDVLVSVTSDEDLAAVMEEYDRVSPESKIRAVLFPVSSLKKISPVPSVESLVDFSASKRLSYPRRSEHRRSFLAGPCRDNPLLQDRKSLLVHDSNIQWLNKKRLGGR